MTGNVSKTRGVLGATGPRGPQGIQGPQGEQGEKGDSPAIVLRYEKETGNLYYNSDGILVDKEYVETQNLVTRDEFPLIKAEYANELDRVNYYGDANIVPSDNSLFTFITDDETMTAGVCAVDFDLSGDIVIPYNYVVDDKVYKVTSFGVDSWGYTGLEYCEKITSVIVPKTITSIPTFAFRGCENLTSVKLPDGLTSIGDNAFQGCGNLESIKIPDSVTLIDYDAFTYCVKLNNVVVPDNIKVLSSGIFSGCYALTNVKFSDDIIAIDESAFYGSAITNIKIPDTVTYIGETAFARSDITSIELPDKITSILDLTFLECKSLQNITIPAGVTSISRNAFSGCEALTDIYFKGSKEQWEAININSYGNDVLSTATIHYNWACAMKYELAKIQKIVDLLYAKSLVRTVTINLLSSDWVSDNDNLHSQVVPIAGITQYSKVDLQPTAEQLTVFHEKDISFVAENDDGVVAVYCIGQKPANDYSIQATVTEVEVDG